MDINYEDLVRRVVQNVTGSQKLAPLTAIKFLEKIMKPIEQNLINKDILDVVYGEAGKHARAIYLGNTYENNYFYQFNDKRIIIEYLLQEIIELTTRDPSTLSEDTILNSIKKDNEIYETYKRNILKNNNEITKSPKWPDIKDRLNRVVLIKIEDEIYIYFVLKHTDFMYKLGKFFMPLIFKSKNDSISLVFPPNVPSHEETANVTISRGHCCKIIVELYIDGDLICKWSEFMKEGDTIYNFYMKE